MNKSKIEWCDYTWNPVTGCLHGCEYCYAEKIAKRFGEHKDVKGVVELHWKRENPYPYDFYPTFHKYRLEEPKAKTKHLKIFVCSMSDLFGDWVPYEWIEDVFKTCEEASQHNYIFLTKNPRRYYETIPLWKAYHSQLKNIWLGTTITSSKDIEKALELLCNTNQCNNKFLSIEPLQGEIDLNKCELLLKDYKNKATIGNYIDWVIVGAQTGSGAIPPKKEWVQKIIDQCRTSSVPVFLKNNLNWTEKIQEYPEGLR